MKKLLSFLLVAVFAVSLLTCSATALAAEAAGATMSVSGLSDKELHTGDTVEVTITITATGTAKLGGASGSITATGLEFVEATGGDGPASATAFSAAYASNALKDQLSWTITYKVTAATGAEVSVTAAGKANDGVDANYAEYQTAGASDKATVVAASEPTPVEVEKSGLSQAIEDAEALKKADYTAESWEAFQAVLADAITVLDDEAATQQEVDDATAALNEAITALVKVQKEEPVESEKEPTPESKPEQKPADNSNKDDVPKTGDATVIVWPMVALMAAAGTAAAIVIVKKVRS